MQQRHARLAPAGRAWRALLYPTETPLMTVYKEGATSLAVYTHRRGLCLLLLTRQQESFAYASRTGKSCRKSTDDKLLPASHERTQASQALPACRETFTCGRCCACRTHYLPLLRLPPTRAYMCSRTQYSERPGAKTAGHAAVLEGMRWKPRTGACGSRPAPWCVDSVRHAHG